MQDDGVHYGAVGMDDFAIYEGSPVTTGAYVAFDPAERDAVDRFSRPRSRTARGHGGWTQYSDRYYAAFVNDLHGNNVEAVWHAASPVEDAPRRPGVP